MTKKEIKLETIKANREKIVNAIKEEITGSDLSLKAAMEIFLNARVSDPTDLTFVMANGIQAVTNVANKIGNRAAKKANVQYFMTDAQKRQLPSSMRNA